MNIKGQSRKNILSKTSNSQKQKIVTNYHKRKEKELHETHSIIDTLSGKELNEEIDKALSDPDINITGAARASILLLSDSNKRLVLKQYVKKKNTTDDIIPTYTGKLLSINPNSNNDWHKEPEFFIAGFANRYIQ